jgi:hypothetical protein
MLAAAALLEIPSLLPSVIAGPVIFGAAIAWLVVGLITLAQRLNSPDLQGRVYSAIDTLITTPKPSPSPSAPVWSASTATAPCSPPWPASLLSPPATSSPASFSRAVSLKLTLLPLLPPSSLPEGALVFARADRSMDAFELVAAQMLDQVERLIAIA